jgi:serine/threonine-protein kinase RsbW
MDPLCVPGTLDSLDDIGSYVMAAAREAGLDKKASYRLRLAVDEIATNIIVHGYAENGLRGDVTVRAALDAEALTVCLEDAAVPFDPRSLPTPDHIDDPLAERPIGGLGVYLALHDVDAFDYLWRDGRNHNMFVMHRAAVAAKEPSP